MISAQRTAFEGARVQDGKDHQVVTPNKNLKAFARKVDGGSNSDFDMDLIAKAEAALQDLSGEFDGWMNEELARLVDARLAGRESGFDEPAVKRIYAVAHDIRGQATTLGYPLAARVCESLCKLIDTLNGEFPLPHSLIEQHVDATRAIVREGARADTDPLGSALAGALEQAGAAYLAATIPAPPIAPE